METHFAVGRLTQSYVKAALQRPIYNNAHLEQCLTLRQVDLGLRKIEKENGRGYIFFQWVSFKSLFLPSAPAVEFSLCLCCVLFHGVGQLPSDPISVLALHPLFLQCKTQVPHF